VRSAQSTLSVDVQDDGPTVLLRLDGEIDITSSPLLQAFVDQALANRREPACRTLVVDMSGVSFADASGISPLLMARAVLSRRGGSIELRRCRRAVLRLVRVLGVDDMLAVEERTVG
jgi:anti-anti-sigma factor